MPYFQQYSPQKRKKIALWCAVGIGIILVAVLVVIYSNPATLTKDEALSARIRAGYTTILEGTQSYFTDK
ncbi:MAG TPA: hypothetical protein VGE18_00690 [Candidatus Paceibacterota bacterium]